MQVAFSSLALTVVPASGLGGTVRVCHLQAFLLLLLSRFSYDRREVSMDAR